MRSRLRRRRQLGPDEAGKLQHERVLAGQAAAKLDGDGLMRLPEVLAMVSVSRSSWWSGIRDGRYPRPVRIGARSVAWRCADIRKLIESAGEGGT